jgi:hypothetical protein
MDAETIVIGVVGTLLFAVTFFTFGWVKGVQYAFTHPRKVLDTLDKLEAEEKRKRGEEP